eukprot:29431-Eustigmatos_ZCMA.PRE.1
MHDSMRLRRRRGANMLTAPGVDGVMSHRWRLEEEGGEGHVTQSGDESLCELWVLFCVCQKLKCPAIRQFVARGSDCTVLEGANPREGRLVEPK